MVKPDTFSSLTSPVLASNPNAPITPLNHSVALPLTFTKQCKLFTNPTEWAGCCAPCLSHTQESDSTQQVATGHCSHPGLILGFTLQNKPLRAQWLARVFCTYTCSLDRVPPGQLISAPVASSGARKAGQEPQKALRSPAGFCVPPGWDLPGSGQTPTQPWIPSQHVSGTQERQGSWAPFLTKLGA